MCWEAELRAGLAVAERTWEAQADSGTGSSQCGWGAVEPGSLMVPVLPLLVSSSLLLIPGLAPHSGKPMAGCHLMEVLRDLVPLFLELGMAAGACWSPLMGLRTSGLLN